MSNEAPRVFVTGATGFTGAHLVRRLLSRGCKVVGLDSQPGLEFEALQKLGAELHIGSVIDADLVDQLMAGCDRLFHLAAAFRKVNLPRRVYWDVNVVGTRNVLEAARRHGVARVLYCSTCGVHGNVEKLGADESSPISPADWYQETKWEGEVVCRKLMKMGMWITIVRPAAIYGPGDPERFLMIFKRAATGRFFMVGDGQTHYHPVYVDDLVDSMLQAIESDAARGNAYLIADSGSITIKDLVTTVGKVLEKQITFIHLPYRPVYWAARLCEIVFKALPFEPPIFPRRVDWFIQNRSFDISAARRDCAFRPKTDLQKGLQLTAAWYKEAGYL